MKDMFNYIADTEEKDKLMKKAMKAREEVKKEFDKKNKKEYILLYVMSDDEDEKRWMPFIGRDALVAFIKTVVEEIDIKQSRILIDELPLKECLNVYDFMVEMRDKYDDGFDIEDYN